MIPKGINVESVNNDVELIVQLPMLRGEKGDKPTKGEDYFTPEDKKEIANMVTETAITDFNINAKDQVDKFNSLVKTSTATFNENVATKTNTFDEKATNAEKALTNTLTDSLKTFNENANTKTETFNSNAETTIQELKETANSNITNMDKLYKETENVKTNIENIVSGFDNKVIAATNIFNENATNKTSAVNNIYNSTLTVKEDVVQIEKNIKQDAETVKTNTEAVSKNKAAVEEIKVQIEAKATEVENNRNKVAEDKATIEKDIANLGTKDDILAVDKKATSNTQRTENIERNIFDSGLAEGEAPLTVKDSALSEAQEVEMGVAKAQETTKGYNLFSNKLRDTTVNGITVKVDKDGIVKLSGTSTALPKTNYFNLNIPILKAGKYILSGCHNGKLETHTLVIQTDSKIYVNNDGETSFEIKEGEKITTFYIEVRANQKVDNVYYDIMIKEDKYKDKPYEKYTGGQASPNPNYPQQINKIDKDFVFKTTNADNTQETTTSINLLGNIVYPIDKLLVRYLENKYKLLFESVMNSKIYTNVSSVTIPDMKLNGRFLSTVGGTLVDKTITFAKEVASVEIVYEKATPNTIQLAEFDNFNLMFNSITNIITSIDNIHLKVKYYRDFITTIRNLQVDNGALQVQLQDIEARIKVLESKAVQEVAPLENMEEIPNA